MSKKTTVYVKTEETIVRRRQTVVKVEASYVQLYKNIRQYTAVMNPGTPVDLMLFLITYMNDTNGVSINQHTRAEYNKSIKRDITERTFYRIIKNLVQNNILIPISRGEYKMNPAIVWQGDIGTRLEHIRFLEEGGVPLKPNETLLLDKKQSPDEGEIVMENPQEMEEMAREVGNFEEEMHSHTKGIYNLDDEEDRDKPISGWDTASFEYPKPE